MSSKLLQLSLYFLTVIQLMSLASTYDVVKQVRDEVDSDAYTDMLLNRLLTAVSQFLQQYVVNIKANITAAIKHKLERGKWRNPNVKARSSDFKVPH